jgi:hypothetical protein
VTLPVRPWEDVLVLPLVCDGNGQITGPINPPNLCPAGSTCTGNTGGGSNPGTGGTTPETPPVITPLSFRVLLDLSSNWLEEDHDSYGSVIRNADGTLKVTVVKSAGWDGHYKLQEQNSGSDSLGLSLAAGDYCYEVTFVSAMAGGGVALELVEIGTWRSFAWKEALVTQGTQTLRLCFHLEEALAHGKLSLHLGRLLAGQSLTITVLKLEKQLAAGETPAPVPTPNPQPQPQPDPVPVPQPDPTPVPLPLPKPDPIPVPVPQPDPVPTPVPPVETGYAVALQRCYTGGASDLEHRMVESTQSCPQGFTADGHGFTVWSEAVKQGYQLAQLTECRKASATRTVYNFRDSTEVTALRANSAWVCNDKPWYIASSSGTAAQLGWSTVYRYDNDTPYSTTLLGPNEGLERVTNAVWTVSVAGWAANVK